MSWRAGIPYPRVGHRGLRVGRQQTVFPAGAGEPLALLPRGA